MLKMSYAGCQSPSPAILAQFACEMCVAAGNRKKSLKTPILGLKVIQGHRHQLFLNKSYTCTQYSISMSQLFTSSVYRPRMIMTPITLVFCYINCSWMWLQTLHLTLNLTLTLFDPNPNPKTNPNSPRTIMTPIVLDFSHFNLCFSTAVARGPSRRTRKNFFSRSIQCCQHLRK